jgi:uncharacterized protein involved in type VI secretion and phage assembly
MPSAKIHDLLRRDEAAHADVVHLHAQCDWTIVVESDKAQRIGHDESLIVEHDRNKTVVHDEDEHIGGSKTITVGEKIALVCGQASITMTRSGEIEIRGASIRLVAASIREN